MKILGDANILIRTANPVDPEHQTSIDALRQLAVSGHELIVVPQVLYEYWVVATRPDCQQRSGDDCRRGGSRFG